MNQRDIITKVKVKEVVDFMKMSCDYFKKDNNGCKIHNLDENFVIAVGWSNGYDMSDENIIKSSEGQNKNGSWVCGYAVNAGVKIRNDFFCCDYDHLMMPICNSKESYVWDTDVTMQYEMKEKDYKNIAKYLLKEYVAMVNALKHHKIKLV